MTGGRHDPAGLARAARGILVQDDADVIYSLPDIDIPTFVVVGERDRRFLPPTTSPPRPDAEHIVPGPDTFNRAVVDFLSLLSS
jgi:pimeloyl-ACP methyl ester carboxylesterase